MGELYKTSHTIDEMLEAEKQGAKVVLKKPSKTEDKK